MSNENVEEYNNIVNGIHKKMYLRNLNNYKKKLAVDVLSTINNIILMCMFIFILYYLMGAKWTKYVIFVLSILYCLTLFSKQIALFIHCANTFNYPHYEDYKSNNQVYDNGYYMYENKYANLALTILNLLCLLTVVVLVCIKITYHKDNEDYVALQTNDTIQTNDTKQTNDTIQTNDTSLINDVSLTNDTIQTDDMTETKILLNIIKNNKVLSGSILILIVFSILTDYTYNFTYYEYISILNQYFNNVSILIILIIAIVFIYNSIYGNKTKSE